jgi:hypothetical protein
MGKSSSIYNDALSVLMERFPMLALQAGTWEEKKLLGEKIPTIDVEKAEVLYFYGLGTGSSYTTYKSWLQKKGERKLIILEDDPGVICSFLHREEALELLSNPQVYLELFSKKPEEMEALANRFPVKRAEVLALPSKGKFQKMRLQLLRKTALSHALHCDRLHGHQIFSNFVENLRHLPYSFYANRLKNTFKDVPAIVCGAGPSLAQSIETLKTLENKALLIAGGSTIAALSSKGIIPHFGMAIDPNLEEYRRFRNSFAFDMPLLYSTRVHPGVFQTCNGPFGYMRSGIGGAPELWIEEELGLLEPLLGEHLPPETISVTAICVAWAQFLGCNPILLNGVDMAYTGNKRYASGVIEKDEPLLREMDAEKSAADRIVKRKDRFGKYVSTAIRWVMESDSISLFAKKYKKTLFINTTEGGIGFKGIDYVPLAEATRCFKEQELRKQVFEKIQCASMDKNSSQVIQERLQELTKSLDLLIEQLEILAKKRGGSAALAEIELKEQIAFLYLFYDIYQILPQDDTFWHRWLDLALQYKAALG